MSTERFDFLFRLYLSQKISSEQEEELMKMLLDPENEHIIKHRIDRIYDDKLPEHNFTENQINRILGNILSAPPKIRRIGFKRIIIAAASVFFIVLAGFLWLQNRSHYTTPVANMVQEIKAPSAIKAFIVLSGGKKIPVEEIKYNDTLIVEGVQLVKHSNGAIEYTAKNKTHAFNTLENPTGSKTIEMILSDGSKVWLNSGSKLTYPVAFTGRERRVDITGEALFDVTHNPKKPFIVQKESTQVKVLGTLFNVKAYYKDKAVEVTLVKGKVVVYDSETKLSTTLSSGQQAKVGNSFDVIEAPDVAAAVAWQNETFVFNNQSIEEIGYTLSRWYNVELEFKNNNLNDSFSGIISRNASLNETVKMLNTGGVQVELINNKIIF